VKYGGKELATPDPFRGGKSTSSVKSTEAIGNETRKGGNKLLSSKKPKSQTSPYDKKCKECRFGRLHLVGAIYCQQCSYKNGICPCCGIKVLDTVGYKQSTK
jgi:hypothetical protein